MLLAICFLLLILGLTLSSTSNNLKIEESKNAKPAKLEELIIGLGNISNVSWQILEDLIHAHNAGIKDVVHFGNKVEAVVVRLPQSNSESFINSVKDIYSPPTSNVTLHIRHASFLTTNTGASSGDHEKLRQTTLGTSP